MQTPAPTDPKLPCKSGPITVFIADDHALVREGLRLILEAEADMDVIGEASDGQEAWKRIGELQPDVALLDVSMPNLNGAQTTERLRFNYPKIKILAVSAYGDEVHIRQLLASGASGYVLKKAAPQELANAIRVVAAGGVHLDPQIAGQVVGGFVNSSNSDGDGGMSAREVEVLILVAYGHTNKEIAAKLNLSVKTIEGHKTRINEKLRIKTRADLVRYALRRGWLRDE